MALRFYEYGLEYRVISVTSRAVFGAGVTAHSLLRGEQRLYRTLSPTNMAQPTARQPYSAWPHSPPTDPFMPPAKRQRLSPNPAPSFGNTPQSLYANSPNHSHLTLPNAYNAPRPLPNAIDPLSRSGSGVMGPPQRPTEKNVDKGGERHMDINDLSDLVTSSGIDLREEENYLANSYRSNAAGQTVSSQNNFDLFHQGSFPLGNNRGSGVFNQPPSAQTPEQELYERHKKAARDLNEKRQHHLEDPFLWGSSLRQRLEKISNDNGVKIPVDGLFDRIPERQPEHVVRQSMTRPDGSGLTRYKAPSILNRNAPLDGIMSLLSLAANERLRGLIEDAYGTARGRRIGSDGIVPPEWADLTVGDGGVPTTVKPVSLTGTAWDAAKMKEETSNGVDSNRMSIFRILHIETANRTTDLPSPPASVPDAALKPAELIPLPSTAFPPSANPLSRALSTLTLRDRQAEEARLRRRTERARARAAAPSDGVTAGTPGLDGTTAGTAAAITVAAGGSSGTSTPATPASGTLGDRAPEVKLTKKERERLAKASGVSEEQQTRNANSTATMQLGGKSYNWMSRKAAPPTPAATTARLAAAATGAAGAGGGSGTAQKAAGTADSLLGKVAKLGEWREDAVGGKGVQMRDWVGVLEADGKEKKTLCFAMARLGRERTGE